MSESQLPPEWSSAINELMVLAGLSYRDEQVTPKAVMQAVSSLRGKISGAEPSLTGNVAVPTPQPVVGKKVLIAGQLGIVVHQLRQAFSKLGSEVTIVRETEEVIAEYQKHDYAVVIIDLFMPTAREGLMALEEIYRISVVCKIESQIIVLAPPSKDKAVSDLCKAKGATLYLEKIEGWHKTVLQFYQGELTAAQIEQQQT